MKPRNMVSVVILAVITVLLLPFYTLSFFGGYIGKFSILGMDMEHEWVGVGMLIAGYATLLLMHKKIDYKHLIVPIIGAVLFLSDFMSGSISINISGSLFSILFGIVIGALVNLSIM